MPAGCIQEAGSKRFQSLVYDYLGWSEKVVTLGDLKRFWESEINSLTTLGIDGELKWSMTDDGLVVERPEEKPYEHACVTKIKRKPLFGLLCEP